MKVCCCFFFSVRGSKAPGEMNIKQQCLRVRLQKTMTAQPKNTGLSVASCDEEEKGRDKVIQREPN